MDNFTINFIDHIAIKVRDINVSANWYEQTLGLKKYTFPEWGSYPILMLAGRSGIALFPAKSADVLNCFKSGHFAFNVNKEELEKAKEHFNKIGLAFEFQDHVFFHSIYIKDPDDYTVELTALVTSEEKFYR
ncbi:MAG: VOC family protein [Ferruginibacter sp.]